MSQDIYQFLNNIYIQSNPLTSDISEMLYYMYNQFGETLDPIRKTRLFFILNCLGGVSEPHSPTPALVPLSPLGSPTISSNSSFSNFEPLSPQLTDLFGEVPQLSFNNIINNDLNNNNSYNNSNTNYDYVNSIRYENQLEITDNDEYSTFSEDVKQKQEEEVIKQSKSRTLISKRKNNNNNNSETNQNKENKEKEKKIKIVKSNKKGKRYNFQGISINFEEEDFFRTQKEVADKYKVNDSKISRSLTRLLGDKEFDMSTIVKDPYLLDLLKSNNNTIKWPYRHLKKQTKNII